ncbi:MAG: TetR/AcrR family transcriptional regulator [Aeromicrobium sp.]
MSHAMSRGSGQVSTDNLLDAADHCFAQFGVERTTMADVAAYAGVHRATMYRYFADRDQLILAVLMRASAPLFERAAEELGTRGDAETAVVEAVSLAIDEALTDVQLTSLFGAASGKAAVHVAALSNEFFARAFETTVPTLRDAQASGRLRPGIDPEDACRWLMRIAMSLLSSDPRIELRELRRLLRTYVTAAIFLGEEQ